MSHPFYFTLLPLLFYSSSDFQGLAEQLQGLGGYNSRGASLFTLEKIRKGKYPGETHHHEKREGKAVMFTGHLLCPVLYPGTFYIRNI